MASWIKQLKYYYRIIRNALKWHAVIYNVEIIYGGFWNLREYIWKKNLINRKDSREVNYYWKYLEYKNAFVGIHAKIEEPPILPHGLSGIYISESATIGKGVTVFQHVTIGSNMFVDSSHQGAPTIGNNVFIGSGAIIVGKVNIGNNCRIGAGSVVYKDAPANSTVVTKRMDIIQHDNNILDNTFIPNDKF